MPVFHVSGGGSALQDALLSTVYNKENLFLIEDGVYDPIVFSSNTITANGGNIGSNTPFVLSSINGAENCIIDGGTVWENNVFDGTMLSIGRTCLSSDLTINPQSFKLSCIGLTFKNGYSNSNNIRTGSAVDFYNSNNKIFYNCIVEKCYAEVSAGYGPTINVAYSGGTMWHDSKIRNIVGNQRALGLNDHFYRCNIENVRTFGNQPILGSGKLCNCIVHDINNGTGAVTEYGYDTIGCLFYNIQAKRIFNTFRRTCYGNTIILSGTTTADLFTYNNNTTKIIANNVFTTGNIKSNLSSPTVIVMNNYARSFSGNEALLSGNVAGTDPLFADPVNLNFRLSKYSPCISAGSAEWLSGYYSQYDFDGKYWKDPPSMGAYQFSEKLPDMPNFFFPLGGQRDSASELGYDAQLQYLESTGAQWIATNYVPTNIDVIKAKFMAKSIGNSTGLFRSQYGNWDANPNYWLFLKFNNNGMQLWSFSSFQRMTEDTAYINKITNAVIDLQNGSFYANVGDSTTVSKSITVGQESINQPALKLFLDGTMRIYAISVVRNDIVIHDFIPVRIGQTGYIFDKVSGEFFANQGTGNFTLGPDL